MHAFSVFQVRVVHQTGTSESCCHTVTPKIMQRSVHIYSVSFACPCPWQHLQFYNTHQTAGKLKINSSRRATQVRKAIEQLGPAYVKVAQAVSTRGDVLNMDYLLEIEKLQDRVPPFPTKAALLVMAKGQ